MKNLNKEKEAIHYYKKSIESNPNYPYSYLNLAVIYRENDDYNKAIDVISEGIENNNDASFLYYNRSCFYANVNNLELSLKDLEKSIEMNEIFLDYMKKDRELDKIRKLKEYDELFGSKL